MNRSFSVRIAARVAALLFLSVCMLGAGSIAQGAGQLGALDIDIPPPAGTPHIPPPEPSPDPLGPNNSLIRVLPSKSIYQAGDEIVLTVATGIEGATVKADFSALDSGYRAQSGRVESLGAGRYRVSYRLSSTNTRSANEYTIPLTISKDGVVRQLKPAASIVYLPKDRGAIQLPQGRFIPRDWPYRQAAGVTIRSAKKVWQPADADAFTLRQRATLRLEFTGSRAVARRNMEVEVREVGRDGHWQVPVRIETQTCGSLTCTYAALLALGSNAPVADPFDIELRIVSGDAASQPFLLPKLLFTALPFENTHRVSGTIRFGYEHRVPDIEASQDNPNYPQYAQVQSSVWARPVRFAKIVLEDECGHYIRDETDSHGYFFIAWTPVGCDLAQVTVWSVAVSNKAAVGSWENGPVASLAELTTNTSDYRAYSYSQSFWISAADLDEHPQGANLEITIPDWTPAAKAFFMLDNVLEAQGYYYDIPGVDSSALPKINVEYTPELLPAGVGPDSWDGNTATYLPSKDHLIHIPHEPSDFGWNRFAHIHETSHYFQRHYLRNASYGRIGEPLANAQALAIMGSHWFDNNVNLENVDVQANYADGAFQQADWEFCTGNTVGDRLPGPCHAEQGWTWRVLWDLIDGDHLSEIEPLTAYLSDVTHEVQAYGQFDHFDGGGGHAHSTDADDHLINDVLVYYVGVDSFGDTNPDYQDRGITRVDLVDILDGMLCRGHIGEPEADEIVNWAMDFGYDFGGPDNCT